MLNPDPLAGKRAKLAELMNRALAASFHQGMDAAELAWKLERYRGKRFTAEDRDIRSLPESQLDHLISYYGGDASPRRVW